MISYGLSCLLDTSIKEDCQLIVDAYNNGGRIDDELLDAACDTLGYTHVHQVKDYPSNIEVLVNGAAPNLWGWKDRDHWLGCTLGEFEDFLRHDLRVLSRDIDKLMCNPYILSWGWEDDEL